MGFFDFLFHSDKKTPAIEHNSDVLDARARKLIMSELDLDMVIATHENWKTSLQAMH